MSLEFFQGIIYRIPIEWRDVFDDCIAIVIAALCVRFFEALSGLPRRARRAE